METRLATEHWLQVPLDEVVLMFLRSEAHKLKGLTAIDRRLICTPDLRNAVENLARCNRQGLFLGLPPDTRWHKVHYLRNQHLDELRILREPYWNDPAHQNELGKVAQQKPFQIRQVPTTIEGAGHQILDEFYSAIPGEWQSPILWGHGAEGPFTILEGTHRFVWYYPHAADFPDFQNTVYVGLSSSPCYWHLPDACNFIYSQNPLTLRIETLQHEIMP